jgi:hypothetical protein
VVDEEDAVGEQRVEEGGGGGDDAVAQALFGGPHDVPALGAVGSTVRRRRCWRRRMSIHGFAQVGDGARVRRRAGPAEAVEGLVASESQDEVRTGCGVTDGGRARRGSG